MKKLTFLILIMMSFFFILVFAAGSKGDSVTRDIPFEKQKLQILKCESDYRHDGLWGDGGKAYGIAQFHKRTFNRLKVEAGMPQLRWKSLQDQLRLFDWALRNGHAGAWTCASKTKLAKVKKNNIAKKASLHEAGTYASVADTIYNTSMVDYTTEVDQLYDISMVDV